MSPLSHRPEIQEASPGVGAAGAGRGPAPEVRAYGLWESPLTASMFGRGVGLGDVRFARPAQPAQPALSPTSAPAGSAARSAEQAAADGGGPRLVWLESRAGRGVLVTGDGRSAPEDVTADHNVRARLGYGGGEFTVHGDVVFFVADGRLWRQGLMEGRATPLTHAVGQAASPAVSPDGRFVAYVHSAERRDCVAVVDAHGLHWPQRLMHGDDFYMQPAWHPDGDKLAVIAWNHPQMPWDGTELRVMTLRFDEHDAARPPAVASVEVVAGGPEESVLQPEFSPDGRFLAYVSDRSGWWHLYLYDLATGRHTQLTDGEFEVGLPAWVQGLRTYAFAPDGRSLFYIRNEAGFHSVWCVRLEDADGPAGAKDAAGGSARHFRIPSLFDEYTVLSQVAVAPAAHEAGAAAGGAAGAASGTGPESGRDPAGGAHAVDIACIASAPDIPPRVVVGRVALGPEAAPAAAGAAAGSGAPRAVVVRRSQFERFEPGLISMPKAVKWTAPDGSEVHGLYYPPANPRFVAEGLPPAVINIHGGPTSQSLPEFEPRAQWFTSRGYAFLAVNYRGSTGYGRAYREQLKGRWGLVDVEDAVSGARYLVDQGLADGRRLVVLGGSAGGYTVLRALITHPGFFRAGVCLYGVADLFGMASDTHKFEERYMDSLVGPLPQAADLYRELSPVFHAHKIQDPVAVFQGAEDEVVPKAQSDQIVAALRAKGVPHEYHVYEGEGHGWRKPETVEAYYAAVDAFLRKYVVFA